MNNFRFTRLTKNKKERFPDLGNIMENPEINSETWLFVSPHDDDVCIGAGLWLHAAAQAGINVQILIVTDGRMGYCSLEQREQIVQIRQNEALTSYELLGIAPSNVIFLGYPDTNLYVHQGRRKADDKKLEIKGYTGLQNTFTYHLRKIRPQRVLLPALSDLHPDHQITYNEFMMSIYHASGAIWPELGQPIEQPPLVYEMAIYCDFALPPNLELQTDQTTFELKLQSLAAYQSQVQIEEMVEQTRQSGPCEYLREFAFPHYTPDRYKNLFA